MKEEILKIQNHIQPLKEQLLNHRIYNSIQSIDHLNIFMQHHIFAVWDFMSLLKFLQINLTSVSLPWMPKGNPNVRRFINEIVLGEESDIYQDHSISHFELYMLAMKQCGTDTSQINNFLKYIHSGNSIEQALINSLVPDSAIRFVNSTFNFINNGKPHEVASAFTFGREDLIPDMFRALVNDLNRQFPDKVEIFKYYLDRHIEVDEGDHGPLAIQMIMEMCSNDMVKWEEVKRAAYSALKARISLWDGICFAIETKQKLYENNV